MKNRTIILGGTVILIIGVISNICSADAYVYIGGGSNDFLPFGDAPQTLYPTGPQKWEIEGWDFILGVRGNKILSGSVYWGGGLGLLLGGGHESFTGSTTWVNENYSRVGVDGNLEFGYRLPFEPINEHLDMGAKLGGYYDGGSGSESDFHYSHTVLWAGPSISLEPDTQEKGVIANATLRLPLSGSFSVENLSGPDTSYDLDSKSVLRLEAGYKFTSKISIVMYSEEGGFEYEDSGVSFDQELSTLGIELRIYAK